VMGGTIEVEVRASLGNLEADTSKNGFQVKGENPSANSIENHVEAESDNGLSPNDEIDRALKAMVWHESDLQGRPEQFSGCEYDLGTGTWDCAGADPNNPNFPLLRPVPGDYGWGLTQITDPVPTRDQIWDWEENIEEGIERFENAFEVSRDAITSGWSMQHQDYFRWREQNAEGLRERADELEGAGDPETAEQYRDYADELEWTFDPRDHNSGASDYEMRDDLDDLAEAIEAANQLLPSYQNGDYIFDGNNQLPELENRSIDDESFVSDNLDGESVFRVWAYNAYLRYNSSQNFLFDEYGIPLRDLTADDPIDGGPNLERYIEEYDDQNWE